MIHTRFEMSVIRSLKLSRDRSPAKIAIADGEQSWTFSEFDRLTDNIAYNLIARGVEPGDRAALHLLNGPEMALSVIGCLKAGCSLVPINTRLKGCEVDYALRHSGSSCYLSQPELYDAVAASCPAILAHDQGYSKCKPTGKRFASFEDLLRSPVHSGSLPEIAADHIAAILYTSGTTAHPKGVVHTHGTLLQTARMMFEMQLDEDQVVLVMSSMSHLIGFCMLFVSALVNGATAVITKPFEFENALDAIQRRRCTYTLALPVMFQSLLRTQTAAPRDVSSGRYYFCGGDSVAPALREAFQQVFAPIYEVYGLTEIAPVSFNGPSEIRAGSIGKVFQHVRFGLLDSSGSDAEPGTLGEICIQGPHLMKGYWQNPEATVAVFRNGWFRTGDLARCADGYYWFAGRIKELIIRGGSNVSPQEVEAVLSEHPGVAEVAVVGRPDPIWGETVVAHVVLRPGRQCGAQELISHARQRLADYKSPETVIFRDELPKGPTGKIQRRALREWERVPAVGVSSRV